MTEHTGQPRSSILVVDDVPANIELLHAMLTPEYEVLCATGGAQAQGSVLDLPVAEYRPGW